MPKILYEENTQEVTIICSGEGWVNQINVDCVLKTFTWPDMKTKPLPLKVSPKAKDNNIFF